MEECRLGIYEKALPPHLDWKSRLEAAKKAGFDFLEMSIDESEVRLERLKMNGSERASLLADMECAGLRIEGICLSAHRRFPLGSTDPACRKKSLDIMARAIVLARDLGIRTIQIAGYDVYYEPSTGDTEHFFEEGLRKSLDLASQYHVMLAIETMETPFLNTVKKCMHYVERMETPWLQIYPDSGNITNAACEEGTKVLGDLQSGKGHLASLHLKESKRGVYREVPYGTGHVDFPGIICEAQKLGIKRYVAEFWNTGEECWEQELRKAYAFINYQFLTAKKRRERE